MCNPVSTAWPEALLAKGEFLGFEWEVTHNRLAYRCGYVRIPPGHPWHGLHYDHEDLRTYDDEYVDVHGGLTFSEADTHCGKGGPDDAWWLGFDCAHAGDAADPELPCYDPRYNLPMPRFDTVRTTEYVTGQCLLLAKQAAEVLDGPIVTTATVITHTSADDISAQSATT
jgi:hypothetical protein